MTSIVRPMEGRDIPRVLPLLTTAFPCMVITGEGMRWRAENPHPEFRGRELLAVDEHGAPTGFVRVLTLRAPDDEGSARGTSRC